MKKISLIISLFLVCNIAFSQATGKIISNKASGGTITGDTLAVFSLLNLAQTTAGQTINIANRTSGGYQLQIANIGSASVTLSPGGSLSTGNQLNYRWTGSAWAVIPAVSSIVSDASYGVGWDGVTTVAPSKNSLYDKIETLAQSAQLSNYVSKVSSSIIGDGLTLGFGTDYFNTSTANFQFSNDGTNFYLGEATEIYSANLRLGQNEVEFRNAPDVLFNSKSTLSAHPSRVAKYYFPYTNASTDSLVTIRSAATIINKTISGSTNTLSNIAQVAVTNLTSDLAGKCPSTIGSTMLKADGAGGTTSASSSTDYLSPTGNCNVTNKRIVFLAGTTTNSTAPIKLTAGTNMTTTEAGAVEFDGAQFYATLTNSGTRFQIARVLTNTATLDFPSTGASSHSDLTITVTGAVDGDAVSIGIPNSSYEVNAVYSAWVSSSNTVTIRFLNNAVGTSRDPASGTFKATVIKN